MAKSIKLGSDTYLDASGVDGVKGIITSGDLDNYYGPRCSGLWFVNASASDVANCPISYCGLLVIQIGTSGAHQLAFANAGIYYRSKAGSPATWAGWKHLNGATEAYEATPKLYRFSVAPGASKTLKFTNAGAAGEILFLSGYTDIRSAYCFWAETGGNVRTSAMTAEPYGSGIALSTSTSGLKITNNTTNNSNASVFVNIFTGSVESVT